MVTLITVLHVLAAIFLILIVLLQSGKGASLGAAFGGASQTVFGATGATSFLTKLTAASAIIFMVTSLTLAYFSTRSESSLARAAKNLPAVTQPVNTEISPTGQSVPQAEQKPPVQEKK
jgi:preprotein translocase subunit SecG